MLSQRSESGDGKRVKVVGVLVTILVTGALVAVVGMQNGSSGAQVARLERVGKLDEESGAEKMKAHVDLWGLMKKTNGVKAKSDGCDKKVVCSGSSCSYQWVCGTMASDCDTDIANEVSVNVIYCNSGAYTVHQWKVWIKDTNGNEIVKNTYGGDLLADTCEDKSIPVIRCNFYDIKLKIKILSGENKDKTWKDVPRIEVTGSKDFCAESEGTTYHNNGLKRVTDNSLNTKVYNRLGYTPQCKTP